MPLVQGSAIEKASIGSVETHLETIHRCVHEHYPETPLKIMATFEDAAPSQSLQARSPEKTGYVLAFAEDHRLLKISYWVDSDGNYDVVGEKLSRAIPVIREDDVAPTVAKNLRSMALAMMKGKQLERTQVRETAAMISESELYWMSDVAMKIDEACCESDWSRMYEANIERIRTSMHGRIRDIEGEVPKTRYTKIAPSKLGLFKGEMKNSLQLLRGLFAGHADACRGYAFEDKQEFLSAVRESLIAEAQAVVGLLGKAEGLLGHAELSIVASAHDKLADRAKTMALVSSYLGAKAQSPSKEN